MNLRVRLATAFALVAVLTALAVAVTAPSIVGRGFAAMQADSETGTPGRGQGAGPMAGMRAAQIEQETVVNLVAAALVAAALASVLGVVIASRLTRPLAQLQGAVAAVARGQTDIRSGLAGRRDELGALGRSFDAMAAELEGTEDARRRFFQDVAHELKTPLAVIDATTSAVLDGVYTHDDRHLETIRGQSRLLAKIVDDLRTISLAESGALPLEVTPIDARGVLDALARDMAARADAASVRIEVAPSEAQVSADPDRLRQALTALVDNALRHAGAGGWVRLEARPGPTGSTATMVVTDSGSGIAPVDLSHVFDRFYRADPARDRSSGTSGLGLAIVQSLVAAQGGSVRATNEPGAGARFEIELPAPT